MIITLLFIAVTLLGLILIKIGDNNPNTDIDTFGAIMIALGSMALITSLIFIIVAHATANNSIQRNRIEYEGLCKRYEIINSEYEDVSKSDVIADITAWNTKVYNTKYWSENLWTNWFKPRTIADSLYYIPLDKEDKE